MKEIIWSYGEKPEKSSKTDRENKTEKKNYGKPNDAINTALTQSIDTQSTQSFGLGLDISDPMSGYKLSESKKDMFNQKMNQRELVGRSGHNPFLTNNNYLKDLENQDEFLRPQNSNFEK